MLKTLKRVSKLSAVYTLGDIITRGSMLFLLPIYTQYLTPDDYGILAIVTLVRSVLKMVLPLGMTSVMFRFHYQFDDDTARKEFYGQIWSFLIIVSTIACGLLLLLGEPLFDRLFVQTSFQPYIQLAIILAFLEVAFVLIPSRLFKVKEEAIKHIGFSLSQFFITVCFTLYFVVKMRMGVHGAIYGHVAGISVASLISLFVLSRETKINFRWRKLKKSFSYGLPMMPHFVSHWVLNASDRAILERHEPLSQIGVYSLGYQIGGILQIVIQGANGAIMPLYSRAAKKLELRKTISRIATYYFLVVSYVGLLILVFSDLAIKWLTPVSYHEATSVVPWIVGAYISHSLYFLGMNTLTLIKGDSRSIPFATMTAAAVNIIANLVLIPRLGIRAAAISTLAGYSALAFIINYLAIREREVEYEYARILKVLVSVLICFLLHLFFQNHGLIQYDLPQYSLIIIFWLLLFSFGFLTSSERIQISRLKKRLLFYKVVPKK